MTNLRLQTLDIRLLRYFAVVAEENNISRAAQRLFISQPPLSRHIRHLETLLGVTLFVRHTKGLILTAEGERVLELIRPLLALQETTLSALGQLSDDRQQPLRLGLTTAFEQGIFASLESALGRQVSALSLLRHARLPWLSRCAKASWTPRWLRCR
jgi:DNA-binding transcriptional LysR family regulator